MSSHSQGSQCRVGALSGSVNVSRISSLPTRADKSLQCPYTTLGTHATQTYTMKGEIAVWGH